MSSLEPELQEYVEQAAALIANDVPKKLVLASLDITEQELEWILEQPEYHRTLANTLAEQLSRQREIATGLSGIMHRAVETVHSNLKYNRDPKFALQAIGTVSRVPASYTQTPAHVIDPSQQVVRINLTQNFINQLANPAQQIPSSQARSEATEASPYETIPSQAYLPAQHKSDAITTKQLAQIFNPSQSKQEPSRLSQSQEIIDYLTLVQLPNT